MNTAAWLQSALSILSSEPVLGRLFFASVEMAVLAGLVWVAIRAGIVRSPRWQSLLWLLVLVKPFVAVTLGALLPVIQLEAAPPVTTASGEVISRDSARLAPSSDDTKPAHAVEEHAAWVEKGNANAPASTDSVPPYARAWRWPWGLLRTLVTAWATGAFLLATYVAFDRIRLWRLIAGASQVPGALKDRYRELAANLGEARPPRLRITRALESPALAGVFRPTILLPSWLADKEWNTELEWSLRHELAHWKLGDSLANAARQAAQVFFFFHPVTWWAGRKWQEAAELACDRAVVNTESEVEDYAGNLYQVLAQIHGQRQGLLASGLFATRTQIGRRIAELLSDPLKYPARLGARGLVVLMAVAAISLAVGSSFASGKEETLAASAIPVEVQKNIQHAIEMLSTTSEFERDKVKAVFDIVRAQPNRPALAELCEWLKSDVATKRRSAIHIIGALPWEDASPAFQPLQDLLTHKENSTRGMAALTLATIGGSASYDAIVGMAQEDTDGYARRCAAWALGELGDPKALDPLQAVSKDPDANVARNAENAIDRLTFLRAHADATGDAKQVVRGVWLVAGSTPWDETRLGRAVDLVRSAAPDVRKALLDEAASNPSTAIKNSASYVVQKLADSAPPASAPGAPSPTASANTPRRNWGPEQATGAPDTREAGDIVTAWASLTPDEQPEWLLLKYDVSVIPKGVKIYETYNPGAVNKVSVISTDGKEVNVWKGQDPTPAASGKGVSEIAFTTPFKVNAVKIYLDSPRVQGWNEIDAVGLIDDSGKEHWASSAEASTTFAERTHESRQARQEPLSETELAKRRPFSVFGTITDETGNPMSDVEVRASCGMGTLMPTGNTRSGADGKYVLRFGPGMHSLENDGRERVSLQAATIFASKNGFYEKNLCRQGGLGMADVRPEKTDGWPASPTQIVVPNEPYRLDFVMTPAAQVRGKFLDAAGKPIVGQRITVTGPQLGPSSSALTSLHTAEEGLFSFEAPCKPFRLELDKPPADGKTSLMNFQKPGHYEIILTLDDTSGATRVKIQAQSVPSGMTKESLLAPPPIELPAGLPKGIVALSTGDGVPEDKRSLGASGHAIRYARPKDMHFVEAVQFCGSRYGTAEPPKDNFHVYILNEQFQVLADLPFPYAMVERGDMKWYTMRTPSIEVPEQFNVAIAFNPSDTKGIYLGMDKDVEQSHSYQGLPEDGFDPVKDNFDWTVRVFMSKEASGEKGVQRLADWRPPRTVNAFEGLTEAKYDTGNSDGKQSYGGRGPKIELALGNLVPGAEQLKGFRVYGSRYGSGFDPQTAMFKLAVLDKAGAVICEQQFPYSLFSYKEKWVDLVLTTPLSLDKFAADGDAISVTLDPEATQFKGIYFHYAKNPQVSHSSRGTVARGFEPVPDREWMIRAYVTLAK